MRLTLKRKKILAELKGKNLCTTAAPCAATDSEPQDGSAISDLLARESNRTLHYYRGSIGSVPQLRGHSTEAAGTSLYRCGSLTIDMEQRRVVLNEQSLKLTPKEYDILSVLLRHAVRVVTHQYLLREIWGPTHTDETPYLRVYVGQLGKKIEEDPAQPYYLMKEPGVGYRLREGEEEPANFECRILSSEAGDKRKIWHSVFPQDLSTNTSIDS